MSRALTIPLFVLAVTCMICMAAGEIYTVSIVNDFTNNNTVLHGRCRSLYARQNLASFTLKHQEHKTWEFPILVAGDTQDYRCSLRKARLREGYMSGKTRLVIFKQARDTQNDRCGLTKECHYKAADIGISFSSNGIDWEPELSWSNSQQ